MTISGLQMPLILPSLVFKLKKAIVEERSISLADEIRAMLIGMEFPGIRQISTILKNITGNRVRCSQQYIIDADIADNAGNQYVMCVEYKIKDSGIVVKIFYGDMTTKITQVDITEI